MIHELRVQVVGDVQPEAAVGPHDVREALHVHPGEVLPHHVVVGIRKPLARGKPELGVRPDQQRQRLRLHLQELELVLQPLQEGGLGLVPELREGPHEESHVLGAELVDLAVDGVLRVDARVDAHLVLRLHAPVDEVRDRLGRALGHTLEAPHLALGEEVRGHPHPHQVEAFEHGVHGHQVVLPERGLEDGQQGLSQGLVVAEADPGQGPGEQGLLRRLQRLEAVRPVKLLDPLVPLVARQPVRQLPKAPDDLDHLRGLEGAARELPQAVQLQPLQGFLRQERLPVRLSQGPDRAHQLLRPQLLQLGALHQSPDSVRQRGLEAPVQLSEAAEQDDEVPPGEIRAVLLDEGPKPLHGLPRDRHEALRLRVARLLHAARPLERGGELRQPRDRPRRRGRVEAAPVGLRHVAHRVGVRRLGDHPVDLLGLLPLLLLHLLNALQLRAEVPLHLLLEQSHGRQDVVLLPVRRRRCRRVQEPQRRR
mmetsp:Transcript_6504/g.19237  ORF Transcript_6504/g.19237 Transcript_6504/m.19237 type:complete len:480 (-) Transcript_6504:45-1484(-)